MYRHLKDTVNGYIVDILQYSVILIIGLLDKKLLFYDFYRQGIREF